MELQKSEEAQKHAGFIINLDLSVRQEKFEDEEIEDWLKKIKDGWWENKG